jgi:hypothetical protein
MTRTGAGGHGRLIVAAAGVALLIGGFSAMTGGGPRSAPPPVTAPPATPATPARALPPDQGSRDLLPDLDQETPSELAIRAVVADGRSIYVLGFRSAVRNIGDGPLIVDGARPDTQTPSMTVDQVINRTGAPPRVAREVGTMQYVVSPDHNHWHYMQFDRYELLRYELVRAATGEAVVTDRKTGFCLGDRYRVPDAPPAAPPQPVYTGRCGLDQPGLLRMNEGISVGYGDDYSAFLEGQDLPLSGLPDGRYVLVHRVNADGRLRELSYANNAASVLFDLSWPGGLPQIRVLARCPDTDRCEAIGAKA